MDTHYIRFSNELDSELREVLDGIRLAIMRHPVAVQAAFSALAAEGQSFAQTPEGERARARLANSELFSRLRIVWESLSMTAFTERPSEALPSFFLDGIVRAATLEGLEAHLSRTFDEE